MRAPAGLIDLNISSSSTLAPDTHLSLHYRDLADSIQLTKPLR